MNREERMQILKSRIAREGFSQEEMAHKMGLTRNGLIKKLIGESEFWVDEVALLTELLNLTKEEEDLIFFGRW